MQHVEHLSCSKITSVYNVVAATQQLCFLSYENIYFSRNRIASVPKLNLGFMRLSVGDEPANTVGTNNTLTYNGEHSALVDSYRSVPHSGS